MARGKKEEKLSLEEKLERALVSAEEQPYEVPGNWCWTRLGVVSEIVTGSTPSKSKPEYYGDEFPFFKPADLDAGRYTIVASEYLSSEGKSVSKIIPAKSTVVCCIGSIGKSGYLEVGGTTNQQINSAIPKINSLYLYYFINTDMFINELWKKSSATTISIVNKSKMETNFVPLAPLAEQRRIVERIEGLFAKLDEVEETLKITLDEMKTRKMSILHKAFRGELTIQWRHDNDIGTDTWIDKKLDEVCKSIFDGDHMPPPKSESGVHFLMISNVNTGYLSFENTRYAPQEYYDYLTETRKPKTGDILYTLVGSYGIPIVVDKDTPFCFQRHIRLLKSDKIDTYFLWYQMQSHEFYSKATNIASGTAQLTVPIKELRKLKVSCPTEEEQKEIVRILNVLFEKDKRMRQIVESVLNRISLLKKSILAKAFRGELGTNNPNEGSSVKLLKKILE